MLLAAVLFLNYVDRGALPTAANQIQTDLHLSDAQLGVLISALFWTYATLQIPVGWAAERYGAARVLAAGLAVWATSTMLFGAAYSFVTLLVLRMTLGIGESVGFPSTAKILASVVPPSSLGTANGIVAFAYLLGPAVGAYAGGIIIDRLGWRAMFLVFGAVSLMWLLPWSRVAIPRSAAGRMPANAPTIGQILRQRAMWATGLGHFANNFTYYFMLNWLPLYLVRERGFSTIEMTQLAGTAYVVNALAAITSGWGVDRFIARGGSPNIGYKSIMSFTQLGTVACMLAMALGPRPLALGCIFVYQILSGMSSPGVFAVSQIFAGPNAAGRWVGIQNAMGNAAGFFAGAAIGLVIEATGHFAAAFILAAAVSAFGLTCWVFMMPRLGELRWGVEVALASAKPATPANENRARRDSRKS